MITQAENSLLGYQWYCLEGIERESKFIRDAAERLVACINHLPRVPKEHRDALRALDIELTAAKIVIGIALGDVDHVAVLQDHQEAGKLRTLIAAE